MPKLLIPQMLRAFAEGQAMVYVEGATVGDVLHNFVSQYEKAEPHLFDDEGNVRRFVNIFVNDRNIRHLQKEKTALSQEDEVSIVPSIAGGAPLGRKASLRLDEYPRYSRHLLLSEIGVAGQEKLKGARVLLVGTGGLGSASALYLAASGIGRMGLVDFDAVEASNLQRQIIHRTNSVGHSKVESAKRAVLEVNPHIEVDVFDQAFRAENARGIADDYDVIIDGTDNFQTRYLINDLCVLTGKPYVHGSIFRFEGQASVFWTKKGPCYRCLYPEPPPPMPSGTPIAGPLGVLPGVIAVIQATEVIKLIIAQGEPLVGRLLLFDALSMRFKEVQVEKDEECPLCGLNPSIRDLVDYDRFCKVGQTQETDPSLEKTEMTPTAFADGIKDKEAFLLDVREPTEWEICRLEGAKLIPLGLLKTRLSEVDRTKPVFVYCRDGKRSQRALKELSKAGYSSLRTLRGGLLAWIQEIDPAMPKY